MSETQIDNLDAKVDRDIVNEVDKAIADASENIAASTEGEKFKGKGHIVKMIVCGLVLVVVVVGIAMLFSPKVSADVRKLEHKIKNDLDSSSSSSSDDSGKRKSRCIMRACDMDSQECRFEFYFRENCGGCKRFKPVLDQFMSECERKRCDFKIIMHNCDIACDENASCHNYDRVPKLVHRTCESDEGTCFTGGCSMDEMRRWVDKVCGCGSKCKSKCDNNNRSDDC